MNSSELIEVVLRGEDSTHQFKVDIRSADALASEIVAFSNSGGGRIFIGVADDGRIQGLTPSNIGRVNQLISNASSQSVRPPVSPYRGLGSGILRALRAYPAIDFNDDRSGNLFKVTVARPVLAMMPARGDGA